MLKDYLEVFWEWLLSTLKSRIFALGVICTVLMVILVVRLYDLQIQKGAGYYETYVARTKKEILTPAVRGNIYDRNGNLLAGNEVVYNLTIKDLDVYDKKSGEYNEMLLRLIHLLRRFDIAIEAECPVVVNEHNEYEYMEASESRIRRFIRDIYGTEYIEKQAKAGVDVYSFDTQTVMKRLLSTYGFNSNWKDYDKVSMQDALDICNIRYAMSATSYTRYRSTTIAVDISEELRTAVLEAQADMVGVEIEKSTMRVYQNAVYFSNILGYTAKPSTEELEALQEEDETYVATDIVGKSGLEKVYESYLSGTKGTDTVYLNQVGNILETLSSEPAVNGNDIYITLDTDMTVAAYNLIEQRLAAIIVEKLINEDFTADASMLANDFYIPIKDVYFQMINNNVLDFRHFAAEDAAENEKLIQEAFETYLDLVLSNLLGELTGEGAPVRAQATEEMQEYYDFILSLLSSRSNTILMSSQIDRESEVYLAWTEGTISLKDYLQHAIISGWIDSSKLLADEKYSNADKVYELLLKRITSMLEEDDDFAKLLYQMMIDNGFLSGNQICLALIDQGIFTEDETVYESLKNGDSNTAFEYMKTKLTEIEITPAQLALDPCSGSAVVVDEDTGEILVCVSYPGYDLNKFSGSVDPEYWAQINSDLSSPLYNRATQARTAPGSTYKMITAAAGLEEGIVGLDEYLPCEGTYDKLDHPMCWIAREQEGANHGWLNTVGGLAMSCNCYFYELGYRLSLNENGEYDASIGIAKLNEYAQMFGFGEKTGLELEENVPSMTTEYPVTSAIGQGTNNFTTVSLARYATAVASKGTLYDFKLLDKVYDTNGELILDENPTVHNQLEFADSTWTALHQGMYHVTHGDGSAAAVFTDCEVNVAGKSGSAQENKLRANHGMFVSFAPYEEPEIVIAVSIPNGYTAGNAGLVSKEIYRYYYDYISLDDIMANNYSSSSGSTTISD